MRTSRSFPVGATPGFTFLELVVGLALISILTAMGGYLLSHAGRRSAALREAQGLVDLLWDLRRKATTGTSNPCLDFPDANSIRIYRDRNPIPDGYDNRDSVFALHPLRNGITLVRISGGTGARHFVCFESKGILGSANQGLQVEIGGGGGQSQIVRLLPSTGVPRIL